MFYCSCFHCYFPSFVLLWDLLFSEIVTTKHNNRVSHFEGLVNTSPHRGHLAGLYETHAMDNALFIHTFTYYWPSSEQQAERKTQINKNLHCLPGSHPIDLYIGRLTSSVHLVSEGNGMIDWDSEAMTAQTENN